MKRNLSRNTILTGIIALVLTTISIGTSYAQTPSKPLVKDPSIRIGGKAVTVILSTKPKTPTPTTIAKTLPASCYSYAPTLDRTYGTGLPTYNFTLSNGSTLTLPKTQPASILQDFVFLPNDPDSICNPSLFYSERISETFVLSTGIMLVTPGFYLRDYIDPATSPTTPIGEHWVNPYGEVFAPVFNYSAADKILREDALIKSVDIVGGIKVRIGDAGGRRIIEDTAPATNCVALSGTGPNKIVFMRAVSWNSSISEFFSASTAFRDYMLTQVPYRTNPTSYSFYVDLEKQASASLDLTSGGLVSSCGPGAREYRYLPAIPELGLYKDKVKALQDAVSASLDVMQAKHNAKLRTGRGGETLVIDPQIDGPLFLLRKMKKELTTDVNYSLVDHSGFVKFFVDLKSLKGYADADGNFSQVIARANELTGFSYLFPPSPDKPILISVPGLGGEGGWRGSLELLNAQSSKFNIVVYTYDAVSIPSSAMVSTFITKFSQTKLKEQESVIVTLSAGSSLIHSAILKDIISATTVFSNSYIVSTGLLPGGAADFLTTLSSMVVSVAPYAYPISRGAVDIMNPANSMYADIANNIRQIASKTKGIFYIQATGDHHISKTATVAPYSINRDRTLSGMIPNVIETKPPNKYVYDGRIDDNSHINLLYAPEVKDKVDDYFTLLRQPTSFIPQARFADSRSSSWISNVFQFAQDLVPVRSSTSAVGAVGVPASTAFEAINDFYGGSAVSECDSLTEGLTDDITLADNYATEISSLNTYMGLVNPACTFDDVMKGAIGKLQVLPLVASSSITGTVSLTPYLGNLTNVSSIDLIVDGTVHSSAAVSPWTLSLNSTRFADGQHTLKARLHTTSPVAVVESVPVDMQFNNTHPFGVTAITQGVNAKTFIITGFGFTPTGNAMKLIDNVNSAEYSVTNLPSTSGGTLINLVIPGTTPSGKYKISIQASGTALIDSGFMIDVGSVVPPPPPPPPSGTYTLTVSKTGAGSGTINGSGVGIRCDPTCSVSLPSGTDVTLGGAPSTASGSRSRFVGWSGICHGQGSLCHFTMTKDETVSASFEKITPCVVEASGRVFPGNIMSLYFSGTSVPTFHYEFGHLDRNGRVNTLPDVVIMSLVNSETGKSYTAGQARQPNGTFHSIDFTIPNIPEGVYSAIASVHTNGGGLTATCYPINYGAITLVKKGLKLTMLETSEVWTKGETKNITFTDEGYPLVTLKLLKAGVADRTIVRDLAAGSNVSYPWTVPADLIVGKKYTIKVMNPAATEADTTASYFMVIAAPALIVPPTVPVPTISYVPVITPAPSINPFTGQLMSPSPTTYPTFTPSTIPTPSNTPTITPTPTPTPSSTSSATQSSTSTASPSGTSTSVPSGSGTSYNTSTSWIANVFNSIGGFLDLVF